MLGFWYFACAQIHHSDHFAQIAAQYDSVDTMWSQLTETEWCQEHRHTKSWQRILAIRQHSPNTEQQLAQIQAQGIEVLFFNDPRYPLLLKEIYHPPLVLFAKGNSSLLAHDNLLAIVGTRQATAYGQWCTQKIVQILAPHHITFVSGLAHGIDTAVHLTTTQIKAQSIGIIPAALTANNWGINQKAANQLPLADHLFLSETMPTEKLAKFHFAKRNRIIAGLCKWTIIIEAPSKSGALITARYATEENREVWVIPHQLGTTTGAGCLDLINQGAHVITDMDHLAEALGINKVSTQNTPISQKQFASPLEQNVFEKISQGCTLESIATTLGLNQSTILPIIGNLVIKKYIHQNTSGYTIIH